MFDVYYCPNVKCPNKKTLKENEKCPECGTLAQKFGINDATKLRMAKTEEEKRPEKKAKEAEKMKIEEEKQVEKEIREKSEREKRALISDSMSDEEIRKKIGDDMIALFQSEAGTAWMRLGTLLGSSTDQMLGAGFKALINENKIIIRQNELLLRSIKRLTIAS